jgi:pre-rRNA-processing protein TSR4
MADHEEPPTIQLGFCEPIDDISVIAHRQADWNSWDGGQVGGKPSWLNPRDLPSAPLTCRSCSTNLSFLCQLYAPGDTEEAFHRSLYAFACPSPSCLQDTEGSVRILRAQLPADNSFYPPPNDPVDPNWNLHSPEQHGVQLCQVCGQKSKGKCPIQGAHFCGREHQKEYKKHKDAEWLPSRLACHELVVEEEPPPCAETTEEDRDALWDHEDDDSDEDLEQDDLNAMTGAKHTTQQDGVTAEFYARINRKDAQQQCLRYAKWHPNAELWIRSDFQPQRIPQCSCGAPRTFECQIMPQMLSFLLQDRRSSVGPNALAKQALMAAASIVEQSPPEQVPPMLKERQEQSLANIQTNLLKSELDWGTICIYTCTASCQGETVDGDELGAYREEYAWKQPPLE